MENVLIIGSGPAGYTAAIYTARAGLNPLILTGALTGGQLTQTTEIENFPGFPDAPLGFDLMEKMKAQALKFGARMESAVVNSVELTPGGTQKVHCSGKDYECRALIIATGATPRYLGLESETRLKAKGVSACATCDGFFYRGMEIAVVGGGDTAMEEATYLTRFATKVTVIHRRDALRASKVMADRALSNPKIEFAWDSVVEEVLGDTAVEGVRLRNVKTNELREVPCKGLFIALGHVPGTAPFKGAIDLDDSGYILLRDGTSETSVKGVFAAGDCADAHYRQAVTAAGAGCRAAIDVERYLSGLEG